MRKTSSIQGGHISIAAFVIVILSLFIVAFAGLAVWAYINYLDQKNNVDTKISRAVAKAEKEQADTLEQKFLEREKIPFKNFAGPSDYGTLGFKYPKTWSLYVHSDGSQSNGDYEAYFSPVSVPSVGSDTSRYALRVIIMNESYENVIEDFQSRVEKGDLKSSPVKAGDETGTRLNGNFSKDLRGSAVLYKIRDKTAIIRTDADTFKADFEALIKTITFSK